MEPRKNHFYLNNNVVYSKSVSTNILQSLLVLNYKVPYFCYNDMLSIAGNCRMCLVEVKNSIKLVPSCAVRLVEGMEIFLDSYRLLKAREGILELMLVNHPLDCPVCDQGGECDLQDLSFKYGSDKGRIYKYVKRVVGQRNSLFIKFQLTRCIYCTRCVRFFSEIIYKREFGLVGRGGSSEITIFGNLLHPLSGNVVDLCPVGALTVYNSMYSLRFWDLVSYESFDFLDTMGLNIKVELLNDKFSRLLPVFDLSYNVEYISNKLRFCIDVLNTKRLLNGYYFFKDGVITLGRDECNLYLYCSFLLVIFYDFVFKFLYSKYLSLNEVFRFKEYFNYFGVLSISYFYDFRTFFVGLESLNFFKNIFVIGLNLRYESPVLYYKLMSLNKSVRFFFNVGSLQDVYLNDSSKIFNYLFFKGLFNLDKFFFGSFVKFCNLSYFLIKVNLGRFFFFKDLKVNFFCIFYGMISCFEYGVDFLNKNGKTGVVDCSINLGNLGEEGASIVNVFFSKIMDKSFGGVDLLLPFVFFFEEDLFYLNCLGNLNKLPKLVSFNKSFSLFCNFNLNFHFFTFLKFFYNVSSECFFDKIINKVDFVSYSFLSVNYFKFLSNLEFINYYNDDFIYKFSDVLKKASNDLVTFICIYSK